MSDEMSADLKIISYFFDDAIGKELETILSRVEGLSLTADDIIVYREPLTGWAVKEDVEITTALKVMITEELRNEGNAREFVHSVQNLRKEMDFNVEDRITISVNPSEGLNPALENHRDFICREILATDFVVGDDHKDGKKVKINDEMAEIWLKKDQNFS